MGTEKPEPGIVRRARAAEAAAAGPAPAPEPTPEPEPEPEPEEDAEPNELVEKAIAKANAGASVVKNKAGELLSGEADEIIDKWGGRFSRGLKGLLKELGGEK